MPRRRKNNMLKTVKKMVDNTLAARTEVKKVYQNLSETVSITPTIIPLLEMPQGTAEGQRIGNQINLLSFYLKSQVNLGDNGFNNIRISVIKTREPVGIPDVLYEPNGYTLFSGVYANWNRTVVSQVLMDKHSTINQFVTGLRANKYFTEYKKARGKVNYASDAVQLPNEFYYLVLCSDSQVAPHPGVNLMLCSRYTDA